MIRRFSLVSLALAATIHVAVKPVAEVEALFVLSSVPDRGGRTPGTCSWSLLIASKRGFSGASRLAFHAALYKADVGHRQRNAGVARLVSTDVVYERGA